MPMPPLHHYWVDRIKTLAEDGRQPADIHRELLEEAKQENPYHLTTGPSYRSVKRKYDEHQLEEPEVKTQWATVSWPFSFLAAPHDLPWESARAVLDQTRLRIEEGRRRPTIQEAKWFWRLRMASPSLNIKKADFYASELVAWEQAVRHKTAKWRDENIDSLLAFEPWTGIEDGERYNERADGTILRGYSEKMGLIALLTHDDRANGKFIESQFGKEKAEKFKILQAERQRRKSSKPVS